jgi:hypothetical protein
MFVRWCNIYEHFRNTWVIGEPTLSVFFLFCFISFLLLPSRIPVSAGLKGNLLCHNNCSYDFVHHYEWRNAWRTAGRVSGWSSEFQYKKKTHFRPFYFSVRENSAVITWDRQNTHIRARVCVCSGGVIGTSTYLSNIRFSQFYTMRYIHDIS